MHFQSKNGNLNHTAAGDRRQIGCRGWI
jgi:hypothetical protein